MVKVAANIPLEKEGIRFVGYILFVVLAVFLAFGCSKKSFYHWDAYTLPELCFTNAAIIDVVSAVNTAVAKASNGSVTQAVFLDRTPATIVAYPSDSPYKTDMEKLIEEYRRDETNWVNRGACGFETFRYTGTIECSLECDFQMLAEWAQLNYQETEQGIYLSRKPAHLECRAYKISDGLKQMAEDLKKKNQIRVGFDPVASAFTDITKVNLWSIEVPTGPSELTGEFRDASVFKYIPDKSILLVIETPEAHEAAVQALKAKGLWE
ncbi:MAG TPA: hypothetical protein VG077_18915 [Verrucomicrobiae bacterium]|nr:hypothetical protein [Verrucomicrobiae bacterium]